MARLYADEDFDFPVVEHLRRLGHDVLTSREAGHAGQKIADAEVLTFAIANGRAVVTFNRRDFIRLHRQVRPHRGIIVCTRDRDSAALASRIHMALSTSPTLDDQLIRITRPPAE